MRPDLPHKLGLKEGLRVYLVNSPGSFARDLAEISPQVRLSTCLGNEPADVIIAWPVGGISQMLQEFLRVLEPDGAIWIVIPKKAFVSAGPSFQSLLNVALPMGLVDNKSLALSETEYGVRFMIQSKLRRASTPVPETD